MGLLIRPLTEKMVVLEREIRAKTVALESELNERKRAEAALQRRTEELRVVFDTTPVPLIVVDSDLRIQQANKAAQALSDLPGVEMTGKRPGEALHCIHYLDIPEGCGFGVACQTCITRNTVQETFRTEQQIVGIETDLSLQKGKEYVPRTVRLETAYFKSGAEPRVIVVLEDITERKRAEEELQHLHEQVLQHAVELEKRVAERTGELSKMVNLMAGREMRMAEMKEVIRQLRAQLEAAGLEPVADDPLAAWRIEE
jgi:PAS domain-containing protein